MTILILIYFEAVLAITVGCVQHWPAIVSLAYVQTALAALVVDLQPLRTIFPLIYFEAALSIPVGCVQCWPPFGILANPQTGITVLVVDYQPLLPTLVLVYRETALAVTVGCEQHWPPVVRLTDIQTVVATLVANHQPLLTILPLGYPETTLAVPVVHNQHRVSVCVQRQLGAGLAGVVHQPERFGTDYIRYRCAVARPVAFVAGALAVVGGALLRITQYLVGAVDFLHPFLGVRRGILVGMVNSRQPAVGGLDHLRVGGRMHLQDFVEVGRFGHRAAPGNSLGDGRLAICYHSRPALSFHAGKTGQDGSVSF